MKYFLTLLGVAALFVAVFAFKSCNNNITFQIDRFSRSIPEMLEEPEGELIEEVRVVSGFIKISVSSAIEVVLKQGEEEKVVTETYANYQKFLRTEVVDGVLKIYFKGSKVHFFSGSGVRINALRMKVYVTCKELTEMQLLGASDVKGTDFKFDEFMISSSGASSVKLKDVNANLIKIVESGASDVRLGGVAQFLDVRASGAADAKLYDLSVKNVKVVTSGASNVKVTAIEFLDARASGASDIDYKGHPKEVKKKTSGGSDISER